MYLLVLEGPSAILRPAASWEITGSGRPWTYKLDFAEPDVTATTTVDGASVVHPMYSFDAERPWVGVGPLQRSSTTTDIAANVDQKLSEESGTTTGYLVPTPKVDTQLQTDLKALKGRLTLVESTANAWGQGRDNAPRGDYQPQRLGFNPPVSLEPLRDGVNRSILAACGVPASLLGNSDGTFARESLRQFLHVTCSAVAEIIAVELAEKLEAPGLAFNFDKLMASDLSGRARAFQSMVNGGMPVERAAALAGLMEPE